MYGDDALRRDATQARIYLTSEGLFEPSCRVWYLCEQYRCRRNWRHCQHFYFLSCRCETVVTAFTAAVTRELPSLQSLQLLQTRRSLSQSRPWPCSLRSPW